MIAIDTTISNAAAIETDLGNIYRLADHLDATLAMCEDLLRQGTEVVALKPGDSNGTLERRHRELVSFARSARALELAITARVLQARARAVEVQQTHPRFSPLIRIFIGGTAPLADAVSAHSEGLGDVSKTALTSGPQILAFLCSRGILDASTASLAGVERLAATEDYRLAEDVQLGPLMDMIAQFLESLDLAFDLYAEPRKP